MPDCPSVSRGKPTKFAAGTVVKLSCLTHTLSASEQAEARLQHQHHVRDHPAVEDHANVERSTQCPARSPSCFSKGTETEQFERRVHGWTVERNEKIWWTSPHTITVVAPSRSDSCKCHTVVPFRTTVYRDPKASQGTSKTDCGGGRWVAAQKPPNSIWLGKPACWLGVTRSPTAVARASMTSRGKTAVSIFDIEPGLGLVLTKVQSSWGNGCSRAQWEKNITFSK